MTGAHDLTETAQPDPPGIVRSSDGLGVTACTQWFRYDQSNGWAFNHLEDGHATGHKPTPRFPSQAGWVRATWARYHCWLTADLPPKVTFVGPMDVTPNTI